MDTFLVPLGILAIVIVGMEWAMWRLFVQRIEGVRFPRAVDASFFRFFSMRRMRVCAALHTCGLLSTLAITYFFLW